MRRLSRPALDPRLTEYLDRMQSLVDSGADVAATWKAQRRSASMGRIARVLAAVTEGRRRAYLRLERALRSFLAQNEGQGASASEESIQDFLASVDDAIDYGLSAWFFLRDGQVPEPFQTLRLHFPSVWNRASERAESGSESPLAR